MRIKYNIDARKDILEELKTDVLKKDQPLLEVIIKTDTTGNHRFYRSRY